MYRSCTIGSASNKQEQAEADRFVRKREAKRLSKRKAKPLHAAFRQSTVVAGWLLVSRALQYPCSPFKKARLFNFDLHMAQPSSSSFRLCCRYSYFKT